MGENYVSAKPQIDDLLGRKTDQIKERVAALVVEVILDRIQNNTIGKNTEKEIENLIELASVEAKVEILTKALVLVGMNNKTSKVSDDRRYESNKKKIRSRSDIFGGYDD